MRDRHCYIRLAKPSDAENVLKWGSTQNGFDAEVPFRKDSWTVTAFNKSKEILHVPIHQPYFIETLCVNPEASSLEVAAAMKSVTQFLVSQANIKGISEIYYLGSHPESTDRFSINHAYQEVPYKTYRIKLRDLEPHIKEG
jgi:hypothetical protein